MRTPDTAAPLRLGSVPYLNARPLVAGLAESADATLEEAVPSELARRLRAGAFDAALVSAVELFRAPALSFVAGPAITSAGPVQSILLFLRCKPERVRSVGLDRSSRSAAALTVVCLREFLGARELRLTEVAPDAALAGLDVDAVLRIGDPALRTFHGAGAVAASTPAGDDVRADSAGARTLRTRRVDGRAVLDLGAVWTAHTALPFVYALWLARPDVPPEPLGTLLRAARDRGLRQRAALADAFAVAQGLPRDACRDYLERAIGYDLGPAERAGLAAFGFLAQRHGLVDSPVLPPALGEAPRL